MIDPATGEPYGDDGTGATGGSAWGMGNRIPGMLPGHTGLPFQMDESGQWKTGPDGEKIPAWDPGFVPNLFPEMPQGGRKEKSFIKLSRQIRQINDRRAAQGKERLHNPLPDAVADRYERQLDMIAGKGRSQNIYLKHNPVSYRPGSSENVPGNKGGGIVKRRFAIGDLAVAGGGLGSVFEEEEIIESPELSETMGPDMDPGGMQGSGIDYGAVPEGEFREAVSDAVSDRLIAEQVGEPLSPENMQQVDELVALFVERYGQDAFGEIVAEQAAILGIPVPGEEGEIIEEEYVSPEGLTEETMGIIGEAEGYRRGGRIGGPGDGMSDSISANIDGVEPIAVSSGETIIPADATAALGNGDTAAGARRLMEMVDRIRMAKTGMSNQPPAIDPNDFTIA